MCCVPDAEDGVSMVGREIRADHDFDFLCWPIKSKGRCEREGKLYFKTIEK